MNITNSKVKWYNDVMLIDTSNLSWFGQNFRHYRGPINEINKLIPHFERKGFAIDKGENLYQDVIIRKPLNNMEVPIPIATVSKQYSLIQHHDVIKALQDGIKNAGYDVIWNDTELKLSEYGERMHLSVVFPNFDFNPGDNNPIILKINCLNSVDRSTSLEINLSWYRLICSNGMTYGAGVEKFKKVHLTTLSPKDIAEFLHTSIDGRQGEESLYRLWFNEKITHDSILMWIENTITKEWGLHLAARCYNIMSTGYDVQIITKQNQRLPAYSLEVRPLTAVPGACAPVDNAFHASQALSWLAGQRNTLQDQLDKVMQIPGLIEKLLKIR